MARRSLRERAKARIQMRLADLKSGLSLMFAVLNSYRLAELLPLSPLLLCLCVLSMLPDWMLQKADYGAELALSLLLGGQRHWLRDAAGRATGKSCLYSVVGCLDPAFRLPDPRLLCLPRTDAEREVAFPSRQAAGYGNAAFLALCMKLAYEDWKVVRDVVNHEWHPRNAHIAPGEAASSGVDATRTYLTPRFLQGTSFHFMQPAGAESSEELEHVHIDSDAFLLALEDTTRPAHATAGGGSAGAAGCGEGAAGAGVALVLAFRGTEPLEVADFSSDFDAVPEVGEWGCLHPGFLLALGLDVNLNPYHQTLTTYTSLVGGTEAPTVKAAAKATPYEVLREQVVAYMTANPGARLYITGHSLGGALAVVCCAALMKDPSKEMASIKSRLGALYTFGQPRVGDFEFLCHLQVSLLEPSAADGRPPSHADIHAQHTHPQAEPHAPAASGGGLLKGLLLGSHDEAPGGPPLTSRYIRVVNTSDVVPHIPPTLCNVYQHGGDMVYLTMVPGRIQWLTEQPMFFLSSIFTSSLVKLYWFTRIKLGLWPGWKGCDNWLRMSVRAAAVAAPFLVAGLNDHMPGDYTCQIINSEPTTWQPFRSRKKLSRWVNAMRFARALKASSQSGSSGSSKGAAGVDESVAPAASGAALQGSPAARVPLRREGAKTSTSGSTAPAPAGAPAGAAPAAASSPRDVGAAADTGAPGAREPAAGGPGGSSKFRAAAKAQATKLRSALKTGSGSSNGHASQ